METATKRFGLTLAPEGLSLAQELLNSCLPSEPERDPLLAADTAGPWVDVVVSDWAERAQQDLPRLAMSERDLPRLRRFRGALRSWITGDDSELEALGVVAVGLRSGRQVSYAPGGAGAAGLESIVAAELLLATRTDQARRLKVCANPACGAAFYDGSPSNTRRWHDVKTCGNIANLRASRARRSVGKISG